MKCPVWIQRARTLPPRARDTAQPGTESPAAADTVLRRPKQHSPTWAFTWWHYSNVPCCLLTRRGTTWMVLIAFVQEASRIIWRTGWKSIFVLLFFFFNFSWQRNSHSRIMFQRLETCPPAIVWNTLAISVFLRWRWGGLVSVFFCPSANLGETDYKEKRCFLELCADFSIWPESVGAGGHLRVFLADKCAGLAGTGASGGRASGPCSGFNQIGSFTLAKQIRKGSQV